MRLNKHYFYIYDIQKVCCTHRHTHRTLAIHLNFMNSMALVEASGFCG